MNKISSTLLISALFAYACNLFVDCNECFTPPETLVMKLTNKATGENLFSGVDFVTDSVTVFYVDGEANKPIEVNFHSAQGNDTLIFSDDLSWKSLSRHIFYIKFNQHDTDTLQIATATKHTECCTYHSLTYFKYNGQPIVKSAISQNGAVQTAFVIEK